MESSRTKWNRKYADRSSAPTEPDSFLVSNCHRFNAGRVLDVACGIGQNSIYLAQNGLDVTAIDISDVALEHLANKAEERQLSIATQQLDIEDGELHPLLSSGPFHAIVILNYKPPIRLWQILPSLLTHCGILIYCTFNTEHHHRWNFPLRFCIRSGQFVEPPDPAFNLVHFESLSNADQFRDGYVFKKKSEEKTD